MVQLTKEMKKGKAPTAMEIMCDPDAYGYVECTWCNGYGSSMKEPDERCTKCKDSPVPGLIPQEDNI